MEAKYIVFQGDTAKWKMTIRHADFDQHRDDYYVELRYGLLGGAMTIRKDEMPVDEDGNIYMLVDSTDMVGMVKATCHYFVPDTDIKGGLREEVDIQWLCFVVDDPRPRFQCNAPWPEPIHEDGQEHVTYERVFRSDVNTLYLNLRDSQQRPLMDSEGRQLRVRKEEKDIY